MIKKHLVHTIVQFDEIIVRSHFPLLKNELVSSVLSVANCSQMILDLRSAESILVVAQVQHVWIHTSTFQLGGQEDRVLLWTDVRVLCPVGESTLFQL